MRNKVIVTGNILRMHSSRMRTARLLTVSGWGVSACGVSATHPLGKHPPAHYMLGYTLPVDRQTPVKTLPLQTSFAGGKDIVPENMCENVCYLTFYFIVKPHSNFTCIFTHSPMHINITMIVVVNVLGC